MVSPTKMPQVKWLRPTRHQRRISRRAAEGDAERGDKTHNFKGRVDWISQFFRPGAAKRFCHKLSVSRDREVADDEEKGTDDNQRHREDDTVTQRL